MEFLENPTGYYREGMVLVGENGIIYGITTKHENYSNPEMKIAQAILDSLASKGIMVVYVNEQPRQGQEYIKFSALSRQNSVGWEQTKTLLVSSDKKALDPELIRSLYLDWKANQPTES
jgi:hypothetical protein